VQKALAAHADLIETDRLLELIDQFAEAESRMKWVPNKKLHFEVAIIKAIQSLGQATLDEVIQKLGDLRDGNVVADRTARVAEAEPGYRTSKSASNLDPAELWKQVTAKIPPQKAFLRNAAAAAHVVRMDGRNLQLGFAPGDKSLMEIIGTQTNRKFVETLLHEISNQDFAIKVSVDEKVPARPVSSTSVPRSGTPADKPATTFEKSPLIQEAIEMFEGKIKT
jgi:DNA polymerase-3 subunit gamma/tau